MGARGTIPKSDSLRWNPSLASMGNLLNDFEMKLRSYMLLVVAAKAIEGPLYMAAGFVGSIGLERLIKWAWKVI